jgi:hypothetical protein
MQDVIDTVQVTAEEKGLSLALDEPRGAGRLGR